jgi:hypothetical protein
MPSTGPREVPVRPPAVLVALLVATLVAGCSAAPAATASPGVPSPTSSRDSSGSPTGSANPDAAAPSSTAGSSSCPAGGGAASATGARSQALIPAGGTWFGIGIDWGADSAAGVRSRLGDDHTPGVWVQFADFPLTQADRTHLDGFIEQVRTVGGIGLITLEPNGGLDAVTESAANDLADMVAGYQACGVPILIRFAHEMNGSWYAWSQDPAGYARAFRTVAAAIHARAAGAGMLWAPNTGLGYPFHGGRYEAPPGSAAARALDTNGDGSVSAADDPYAPYWPGDDAVDWVGMSVYHFGNTYPWGANVVPLAGAFESLLTGRGSGAPDFYATWAAGHHKPMAIVETAALWRPSGGGASELAIKQGWWRQVFSKATIDHFPDIRLIGWFDWKKQEAEVKDVVDWRVSANPTVTRAFFNDLPQDWLRFAPTGPTAGG